jgi:hypothetical protein
VNDHRITIGDLLAAGTLDRAMVDRAAVEQSLASVAIAMSLCTDGPLRDAAGSDGGLAARIIMRRMEARALDRTLRDMDPSSTEAPGIHRRASALINDVGRDLVDFRLMGEAVESPVILDLVRRMRENESSAVSTVMLENGVERWHFTMRHYHEIVGD